MINIAIDGLAGNGKSTLARGIAAKLGPEFKVLDTGAIFRSFAYACQQAKIKQNFNIESPLEIVLRAIFVFICVLFCYADNTPELCLRN